MGEYAARSNENGKTEYHNETGATLHFNSHQTRWILGFDDEGSKTLYSTSDNAGRTVPWDKRYKMNGKSWRLDAGKHHGSTLDFEGMHASPCSVVGRAYTCISTLVRQTARSFDPI